MLKELLKARVPAIFVRTIEECRSDDVIASAVQEAYTDTPICIVSWTPVSTRLYKSSSDEWQHVSPHKEFVGMLDPVNLLATVNRSKGDFEGTSANVFVFHGVKYFFDSNRAFGCESIYKMLDLLAFMKTQGDTIIFVGSNSSLPDEFSRLFYVYDMPLPSAQDIEEVFKSVTIEYTHATKSKTAMKKLVSRIPKAAVLAQGLTLAEAENAFARSLQLHKDIDYSLLIKHKAASIAQSDVLELIDVHDFPIDNVVGFDAYKDWLKLRSQAFDLKKKLPMPKGCIFVGYAGTGKSMMAKATGNYLNLPVVKFDFSRVFRSLLGDTEELMERSLKILEAVSPAVVFMDEINMSMGGANSANVTDSGVMLKLMQMFLTWRQETKKPVFIVATGNTLETLPPMLYRKGRFDQVYFCGLPKLDERCKLFQQYSEQHGCYLTVSQAYSLAQISEDFSGVEIEHSVTDALFYAAGEDKPLNLDHIREAIKKIQPNSKLGITGFKAMQKVFESVGVLDVATGEPVKF